MSDYFPPPDDYTPPTHCQECGGVLIFGPVIGGHMWKHLVSTSRDPGEGHEAVVGRWWDTKTGQWREGSGLEEILAAAAGAPKQEGQTSG